MKAIPLHPFSKCLSAFVDDEDFERINQFKWRVVETPTGNFYAAAQGDSLLMHQAVLGKKDGFIIDHESGLGLDNRKRNLRHCSYRDNAVNRIHRNKTGFRGVFAHKNGFQVQTAGRSIGVYPTAEEAAAIYNWAALRLRGEFAVVNRDQHGHPIPPKKPFWRLAGAIEKMAEELKNQTGNQILALTSLVSHADLRDEVVEPRSVKLVKGRKNLIKRGNVWYYKRMSKGRITYMSLKTTDLVIARRLAGPILLEQLRQEWRAR